MLCSTSSYELWAGVAWRCMMQWRLWFFSTGGLSQDSSSLITQFMRLRHVPWFMIHHQQDAMTHSSNIKQTHTLHSQRRNFDVTLRCVRVLSWQSEVVNTLSIRSRSQVSAWVLSNNHYHGRRGFHQGQIDEPHFVVLKCVGVGILVAACCRGRK